MLDRNGLRPSRYVITKDDLMVMGSEVGVQTFKAGRDQGKGQTEAGQDHPGGCARGKDLPR